MDVEKTFFVTGLPRTRTAWFSEYLPNCLHEGMEGCYTKAEYVKKLIRGDSSSGLMFTAFQEWFPNAPTVIVERDIDEVFESMKSVGFSETYPVLKEAKKRLNKVKGLRVDYYDLDFEQIWEYLIGDGFNREYTQMLDKVNIQKVNRNPDMNAIRSFFGET